MRTALKMADGSIVNVEHLQTVACPGCSGSAVLSKLTGGLPGEFPPQGVVAITHSVPECSDFRETSADAERWGDLFTVDDVEWRPIPSTIKEGRRVRHG